MRLAWLDLFRGLAALEVVYYHFHAAIDMPPLLCGYLAVDLFFVLSGIVLGLKYTPLIEGGMTFPQFAWHRLRRLYPMAVLVTLLILGMNALDMPRGVYISSEPGPWLSILTILPTPASFGYSESFPPDGAMYTLFLELLANVVWFVALRAGRRFTAALFVVAMLAFIVEAFYFRTFGLGWRAGTLELLKGLVRALAWFGVGYFIALRRPTLRVPNGLLLALLAGMALVFRLHAAREIPLSFLIVLTGTALLVKLMHAAPPRPAVGRLCTWLGMLSYPIYLIHVPSDRIAVWLASRGWDPIASHVTVLLGVGLLAALLSEAIVRRLPRDWPFAARQRVET